jgi:tRNA threonylcarbamoyladenosine biosynthesis protein TsaE
VLRFQVDGPEQQEEVGTALAEACPRGCIIYLRGDLGAGKTTLVRGFLQGLGYVGAVKSPTYSIMEPYEIKGLSYCHLDLYRLAHSEELEYLGLRDLLEDGATLLVEWPERGRGELPLPDLDISIEYLPQGRILELEAETELGESLLQIAAGRLSGFLTTK